MFKKNIGALWRNPFLVVCQIHLNQRSDQLLSGCLICWSKARRWLMKRRGKWWSPWRPTSGWFRTFGAGGQQPGGGLGQPGAGALQQPCPSGKLFQSYNISLNTIPIFTVVSKVLPIPSLPCWLLPRRQHHSMKAFALLTKTFSPQGPLFRKFTTLSLLFCCQTNIFVKC